MKLSREKIALKKQFIAKGVHMTADCVVTTPFETPLDEAVRRMKKVRAMSEQLVAALRGSRH